MYKVFRITETGYVLEEMLPLNCSHSELVEVIAGLLRYDHDDFESELNLNGQVFVVKGKLFYEGEVLRNCDEEEFVKYYELKKIEYAEEMAERAEKMDYGEFVNSRLSFGEYIEDVGLIVEKEEDEEEEM